MASVALSRVEVMIPLQSSNIPTGNVIEVSSFTSKGLFKKQTTDFSKFQQWVGGLQETGVKSRNWLDLLATPNPMLIGTLNQFVSMVIFRTWPKDHKWDDKVGSQKFTIPPVAIGGTWNKDTRKLVWSGVALVPAMPSALGTDFRVHRWPFGNVYEDGHVCWGENSVGDLTSPAHIYTMANRFFDTPFNTDLRASGWSVAEGKVVLNANETGIPLNNWVK